MSAFANQPVTFKTGFSDYTNYKAIEGLIEQDLKPVQMLDGFFKGDSSHLAVANTPLVFATWLTFPWTLASPAPKATGVAVGFIGSVYAAGLVTLDQFNNELAVQFGVSGEVKWCSIHLTVQTL